MNVKIIMIAVVATITSITATNACELGSPCQFEPPGYAPPSDHRQYAPSPLQYNYGPSYQYAPATSFSDRFCLFDQRGMPIQCVYR